MPATPKIRISTPSAIVKMSNIEGNLGKFCDFCTEISRILGSNHPEAIDVPHHKTYKAFLESAEGCPLCSLVIQGLRKYRDGIVGIKCSCSRELRVQVKYSQGLQSNAFAAPLEDNFYFDLFRDRSKKSFTETGYEAETYRSSSNGSS